MSKKSAIEAIRDLCVADIDATSDEQLRAEMIEDGLDPDAVAQDVSSSIRKLIDEFQAAS